MEEMTRHELRRAPTTFLKATESRLRSSLESSTPVSVTDFIEAAMSSYLGARHDGTQNREIMQKKS